MEFRFVDEHDPVALRRRRLQAQHTQRCRQRQKEQHCVEPSIYQAELSQAVNSAADNVQTTLGNNLLADTGESRPDTISSGELPIPFSQEDENLSTIDTGPDYYDEEIVDAHRTDKREDQMEPRSQIQLFAPPTYLRITPNSHPAIVAHTIMY
ncbi:hypothetical protein FMUND_15085 [Fusarium mundagurra]|uniref:Uncharacterized protein n=1 Tax=Fusarium mundagurra TaxID=1567541 RepID=A0A8H5XS83_9HYPO|nr:hypothetical protein FMUND_15085 [Fusarium mundagurra]